MARKSGGGMFGKLVLLGVGALIGSAMTQKKVDSNGTGSTSPGSKSAGQSGNVMDNVKKGIDTLNQQTGGMVDKMKPQISKALDKAKEAIEKQQQMMEKEKDMLDKTDEAVQEAGSDTKHSSGSEKHNPSGNALNAEQGSDVSGSTSELMDDKGQNTPRNSSLDRTDEYK